MFCVDRMPLVKPAATAVLPFLLTRSVVTKTSLVTAGSVQKNSGMGAPVYLLGSALADFGTGLRSGASLPTATISYFTLKSGARTSVVSRERRKVRSRQLNFWIGQTLVSCSSHFGLDCVLNAAQAGRIRLVTCPAVSVWIRVIMKPRQSSIFPSVCQAR